MRSNRAGLTLLELLLTIAVLSIVAAVLIPSLGADIPDRLNAVAQIVAADLDYARSLAVANNSKYTVAFNTADNYYFLQHTGDNQAMNTLPASQFRHPLDTPQTQTTDITLIPMLSPKVELFTVVRPQGNELVTTLEFTPLGSSTTAYQTQVWLACGQGTLRRFTSVLVDPVTGLVQIGSVQTAPPPTVLSLVEGANASPSAPVEKKGKSKGKAKGG